MNRSEADEPFYELHMIGKENKGGGARCVGRMARCMPKTLKEVVISLFMVSILIWAIVIFYHGYNMGSYIYYDAELAVNEDCGVKGYKSNHMHASCEKAKLARGVHPFMFATEYTLKTGRDAITNVVLSVVGSSMMMIAAMSAVAFALALWYIKPSNREPMYIPGVFSECTHSREAYVPKEVSLQVSKSRERIVEGYNDPYNYNLNDTALYKPTMFNSDHQSNQQGGERVKAE